MLSLSLEFKPGRTGSPRKIRAAAGVCDLICINIGVLNGTVTSLTAGLPTYNISACFLLFNVSESQEKQSTVTVYRYPAWRGMDWFGRILYLGGKNLGRTRFGGQQAGQGRAG